MFNFVATLVRKNAVRNKRRILAHSATYCNIEGDTDLRVARNMQILVASTAAALQSYKCMFVSKGAKRN